MKRISMSLLLTFLLSSCMSTHQGSGQGGAIGAGAGAIGGAIFGQLIGGDTKATVLGAALGAAAGYLIGLDIESRTQKVQTAEQTKESVPAYQRRDPLLQVKQKTIEPSQQIQVGQNVTVKVTYVVFDEQNPRHQVRESKSIWHNGELVKVLGDTEEVRDNGTYESLVSFRLPQKMEKGDYEVRHNISTKTLATNSTMQFSVI